VLGEMEWVGFAFSLPEREKWDGGETERRTQQEMADRWPLGVSGGPRQSGESGVMRWFENREKNLVSEYC
jgi:hypothetical protein